jgi:hypothetical protein
MEKRIIEVNGVKLEVDLSTATRIDTFKVGDNVKILIKDYSDKFTSYPGVIVGFDPFKNRPTIIIAYLKLEYSEGKIEFAYITKDTTNMEVCIANETTLPFDRDRVLALMDRAITEAEQKLYNVKNQRAYFLEQFGHYFPGWEDTV